ncbi:MAG: HgcAB-associated protein [Candidatus Bathyarchaeota archaeon]|nr:HgcAB-associated protein [Candidatus Bathyarchaeota archaeon]
MPKTDKECCKINAVVTVDAKGQIVLPKDLREKANIKPNDKLALIGIDQGKNVCCLVVMKVDALEETLKCMMRPILNHAFNSGEETK